MTEMFSHNFLMWEQTKYSWKYLKHCNMMPWQMIRQINEIYVKWHISSYHRMILNSITIKLSFWNFMNIWRVSRKLCWVQFKRRQLYYIIVIMRHANIITKKAIWFLNFGFECYIGLDTTVFQWSTRRTF